ncbi:MAG: hypothetical protein RL757_3120 [Bacteroidota bacterium]|jgi:phosphopantetheinyl transferase
MPLHAIFNDFQDPQTRIGLWQLTASETLDFFKKSPPPSIQPFFEAFLNENAEKMLEKQTQSACAEWLTLQITDFKYFTKKDTFGKPFLQPIRPTRRTIPLISRSHSADWVAVVAHAHGRRVGIDVQKMTAKMSRIMPRLMSEKELNFIENQKQNWTDAQLLTVFHLFWSAKEALYKAYGKRGLDFGKHIAVHNFEFSGLKNAEDMDNFEPISFNGSVQKDDVHISFSLRAFQILDYIFVYCIEI